jgi:NADH:ubiquinone oxidoreductase subunit C
MRRMFLPEDWTGFPMRKDYSEPEQFLAMEEGEDVTFTEQKEGSW